MHRRRMLVYAMECVGGRVYVGRTLRSVEERFAEHARGRGASWTRLHAPVRLLEVKETSDPFEEDRLLKEYMSRHGVENVRGGSYSTVNLHDYMRMALQQELRTASDACFVCGRAGHFANRCPDAPNVRRHTA